MRNNTPSIARFARSQAIPVGSDSQHVQPQRVALRLVCLAAGIAAVIWYASGIAAPLKGGVPDIELSESLPLDRTKTLALPPLAPGEYEFHCQMQMYRGVLKVE